MLIALAQVWLLTTKLNKYVSLLVKKKIKQKKNRTIKAIIITNL